jgi:hypothetical protein
VLEGVAIAALIVLAGAALGVVLIRRETVVLRRAALRYRELELEGIEELPREDDPYPENRRAHGAWMREPDGRRADADRVLHDELERAREHTRRARRARSASRSATRPKGAGCLL